MTPLDKTILDSHLERVFSDLPENCLVNGLRVRGVKSSLTLEQTLVVGGVDEVAECELHLRVSELPAGFRYPIGCLVSFESEPQKQYRHISPVLSGDGLVLTLRLGPARL
jgi:hypothetical protein